MEHEWISVIWWIFRGIFSKNVDGWKRFLMVFWSFSKNWIYIIDQEMKSGFWSSGSKLFLADRLGQDCLNDTFLMLDDESCFEKDGYQTCPLKSLKSVKISEIRCSQFTVMLRSVKRSHTKELSFCAKQSGVAESTGEPSNCHSAWSETESQNLLEKQWWILQLRTKTSSVQNDTMDGWQWIKGP